MAEIIEHPRRLKTSNAQKYDAGTLKIATDTVRGPTDSQGQRFDAGAPKTVADTVYDHEDFYERQNRIEHGDRITILNKK